MIFNKASFEKLVSNEKLDERVETEIKYYNVEYELV